MLVTGAAHAGLRLDVLLARWLPGALGQPLSRSALRRLIMAGAVRLQGGPVRRPGLVVRTGTRVEVAVDPGRLTPPGLTPPAEALRVLYEDDVVLAVDKPPGLPTHATADPRRPHLVGLVKAHLSRGGASGAPYLGVHQRLDRDTSGVVIFAKSVSANAGLARAFAGREVEKTYHALTSCGGRRPPAEWRVVGRLAPSGKRRMAAVPSGGQEAETLFRRLESFPGGLLVEARPRTGRKHQIRVHLASEGLPILGDEIYGSTPRRAPRLMLHAVRLALPHPQSGEPLVIESGYPEDFEEALSRLRQGR